MYYHIKNQRTEAMTKKLVWIGDLSDDCSVIWGILLLRVEWISSDETGDSWWWEVFRGMSETGAKPVVQTSLNNFNFSFV